MRVRTKFLRRLSFLRPLRYTGVQKLHLDQWLPLALHAAGKTSDKGLIELNRSCSSIVEGATEKQ